MDYPYFGFQSPSLSQQLMQQNMFSNPATQYSGAMPATLGGVGASPVSNIQQGVTPNMAGITPLGLMGINLMQQAHQQPGQQQPLGGGLMNAAASTLGSMPQWGNPTASPLFTMLQRLTGSAGQGV